MPIGLIIDLIKKYLPQIIGVAAALIALAYIHHKIDQGGYDRAVAQYEKRDAETVRKGAELLKLKNHEADLINKQNAERAYNAAKTYNDHYKTILAERDSTPKRVYIRTKEPSCDSNTMSGSVKDTSGVGGTGAQRYSAELPETNIRSLNEVIERIEQMQLNCEQLLNIVNE